MGSTQVNLTQTICEFLKSSLDGMKLKYPVRDPATGKIDDSAVEWRAIDVYQYFIPLEVVSEGEIYGIPELDGRCPSVTVTPVRFSVSGGGTGVDELTYGFRLAMLTYDPGVRPNDHEIDLPDTQGWTSALALSDRIIERLRKAGRIAGFRVTNISSKPWDQNGTIVDARPMYRTFIDFDLTGIEQSLFDEWGDLN